MSGIGPDNAAVKRYFVDEAGDPTLFTRGGGVLVGQEGCSRYFILGFLDAEEPDLLKTELDELRRRLLADSYFRDVPSLQSQRQKTALAFHAKDDLPEVRKLVFECLIRQKLRFHAVVRDKLAFVNWVKNTNRQTPTYHYHANAMYDTLVRMLFRDYLHKEQAYEIVFARRGSKDRSLALASAVNDARRNFARKWGIVGQGRIEVRDTPALYQAALQAVDYFLWALQRCYERREDRYIRYLWANVRRVHDLDDRRNRQYGAYYSQRNPLEAGKLPLAQEKGPGDIGPRPA